MSQEIIHGILEDQGYFYLGTVIDGPNNRGIKNSPLVPSFIRHVVYMEDTSTLLTGHKDGGKPERLQKAAEKALDKRWDVSFHELRNVVTGILEGNMSYIDWAKLPIMHQPDPEYLTQIYKELNDHLQNSWQALTLKMSSGNRFYWMPLDYRWVQMLIFAHTGKIEINYLTILNNIKNNKYLFDSEIYESAIAETRFRYLIDALCKIEQKARRGIL